jgi:hypothetical protein
VVFLFDDERVLRFREVERTAGRRLERRLINFATVRFARRLRAGFERLDISERAERSPFLRARMFFSALKRLFLRYSPRPLIEAIA